MRDQILTNADAVLSDVGCRIIVTPDVLQVINRTLDGGWDVQTIGTAAQVASCEGIFTVANRTALDNSAKIAETIKVVSEGEVYTGIISNVPAWEVIRPGANNAKLYRGTFTLLVTATSQIFTLTYSAGANGSITGTNPQSVMQGGDGTEVTAVPDAGYTFDGWSDGVATAARTDTNVQANKNVTASFVADEAWDVDTDFSEAVIGDVIEVATAQDISWTQEDDGAAAGGKVLQANNTEATSQDADFLRLTGYEPLGDMTLEAKVKPSDTVTLYLWVSATFDAAIGLTISGGNYQATATTGGTSTAASISGTLDDWVNVKAVIVSDVIYVKAWYEGSTEPTEYGANVTWTGGARAAGMTVFTASLDPSEVCEFDILKVRMDT